MHPSRPSRREFLTSAAAVAAAGLVPGRAAHAQGAAGTTLMVSRRTLEVNGKAASVFGLGQVGRAPGLLLDPGQRFQVSLDNRGGEPTVVHWHGQTPPPEADGVTDTGYVTSVTDGASASYDFAARPGTHWMHSHEGLQEQALFAAPLIVRSAEDLAADRQEVVVLLHDFSFRDPKEILASLNAMPMPGMAGHAMPAMPGHTMPGMGGMDLNDVEYDAYLANDRTLADPEVIRTERGGRVLLRIINAASSTNFWIDLAGSRAEAVAVDGNAVAPLSLSRFPLAMAQRLDLLVTVPAGGTIPVTALREGGLQQAGIVLAAPGAAVAKLGLSAAKAAAALDLNFEGRLAAKAPLAARKPDITHRVTLTGGMMPYAWSINGRTWGEHQPLTATAGARVVLDMENQSMMAHPMHLHGHHFQVIGVNGRTIAGAVRDTVLVLPNTRVTVAFDADNPGRWLFHCHNLYHMATGMMTELRYDKAV